VRKSIIFILLFGFMVFAYTNTIFAYSSFGSIFGGRIINTKALEIESLEGTGYQCYVPGSSITISPIGSPLGTPTSYFIPSFVTPKNRSLPSIGKLIMGKYIGKTMISCIYPSNPPMFTTVSLDTITLFATSGGVRATQSSRASR
jgi:hypothetical protein